MEERAAKLALARKKLRDHQEKKLSNVTMDDTDPKSETIFIEEKKLNNVTKDDTDLKSETIFNTDSIMTIDTNYSQGFNTQNDNLGNTPTEVPVIIEEKKICDSLNKDRMPELNVTEILISNKRNLELQIDNLQNKLYQLEGSHAEVSNNYKLCNQKVLNLENELQNIYSKYENATKYISFKDSTINELNASKFSLTEEKSNLSEQLEFTKTVLSAKEAENDSLHSQLYSLQSQYDVLHLKLQQLTNGSSAHSDCKNNDLERNEMLLLKISSLEQQLNLLQKERDQINLHYEHYVTELNEQLKSLVKRNEELTSEVQSLSNRESNLIEQISDMEIRIQNYNLLKEEARIPHNTIFSNKELQDDFEKNKDELYELWNKHEELEKKYATSIAEIKQLTELKEAEYAHDDISLSKLNADMTSDKVAAQRATEQNKKLKHDLQGLEDAFVKMSKDKLELTEKLTAEKYLNRELTIKLADIDEKAKEIQSKLKAKDEEMIRLLTNYRDMENKFEELKHAEKNIANCQEKIYEVSEVKNNSFEKQSGSCKHDHLSFVEDNSTSRLPKDDAMIKLQERFLKIMGDVADLSDEKHRLEHIILQLQNETDTICEYVALYQQQRSLLNKRDEERSAQLKIFQQECDKLKSHLEELSGILIKFAEDTELSSYFQNVSKNTEIKKVMALLSDLKNSSLIDPKKKNLEFNNFYPCNCCSGKLIDV